MSFEQVQSYVVIVIFILLIIMAIYSLYVNLSKIVKTKKEQKTILEKSIISETKRETINQLIDKYGNISTIPAIKIILVMLLSIVAFIFIYIKHSEFIIGYFIVPILMFIFIGLILTNYTSKFKNQVLKNILLQFNPKLELRHIDYDFKKDYRKCKFSEKTLGIDMNLILYNSNDNFKYALMSTGTSSIHGFTSGFPFEEKSFVGSFISVPLNISVNNLYIGNRIEKDNNLIKLKTNNKQFDNLFEVYTDTEENVILNNSIIDEILSINQELTFDMEIRIIDNVLYLRFASGPIIFPSVFNLKKEKNSILNFLIILDKEIEILSKLKNILNKDIAYNNK